MKIMLDREKCTGIGICEAFVPKVFEVNDDGDLELLSDTVPAGMEHAVTQAIEGCPTQALSLEA
ncbi:ferredoxin [Nocardia vaccinii]|uniref:ferredoxin n=1 Tax=Nocardia vaccinii TaxID=1822 RepID=UPI00082E8818|nr:ferredoxin [Nocardia vaccinii]